MLNERQRHKNAKKIMGPLVWHTHQRTRDRGGEGDPISNKVKGKDQYLRLSSDLYTYNMKFTMTYVSILTQNINILNTHKCIYTNIIFRMIRNKDIKTQTNCTV